MKGNGGMEKGGKRKEMKRTTRPAYNSADDPARPALRMAPDPADAERDNRGEADALEEERHHEHREARVATLRDGRGGERDHQREVHEEDLARADVGHYCCDRA